ncbi:MAG TPA: DUF2088 domain-containing protein [Verrucomicrobiae bacterium]|nr:DUF2088 domain-containing protein [Verrucomicrobiae bacterium]
MPSKTSMALPRRTLPALARVEQKLDSRHISEVRSDVREKLLAAGLQKQIRPGARIAITAGSRGIGGFLELLAGIAEAVQLAKGKPFLIPAMGSHGGATARGQADLLRCLGVNDQSVKAPIRATMDTLELGRARNGAVAHLDRIAAGADGIIVLGRVKTHPENTAGIASGLLKMVTVGLGKQAGAQQAHSHGLWESVSAVPQLVLGKSKIIFGVAVVENAYRRPAIIEVVPARYENFREADERLLRQAKPHVAKIPFQELDLLIVDEIGKTISGSGMDVNVIGKWRVNGGKRQPNYKRIVALSLTAGSMGNGLGIGLADFTTQRFMNDYDPAATYVNLVTASEPDSTTREGPLPLALANDREAIEVALHSALAGKAPRICRIRNTAALNEFWISEALIKEAKQNPRLSILERATAPRFDKAGNLNLK